MQRKIKVLIVDDSALVRQLLTELLAADEAIEVVGTAADPLIAREKIKQLRPDVLTLDVEMPRMDGLTFLAHLMRLHPMPVVMVSSLTQKGAEITLKALELGAVDFVAKPQVDVACTLVDYGAEIAAKIKAAAHARLRPGRPSPPDALGSAPLTASKPAAGSDTPQASSLATLMTTQCVIAIGASTGGTEAIKEILVRLPPDAPGIVISQHIPVAFSKPFAQRLDALSPLRVCEAADGQPILPGHAYVAPGSCHLLVERSGARYLCRLSTAPPVNRHRPSVDVMFHSVAEQVGVNAIGVLLTGMGEDGARGLKAMREAGAHTIAQDEKTSVVWGMPGAAVRLGAAAEVLPLERIAARLIERISDRQSSAGARSSRSPAA